MCRPGRGCRPEAMYGDLRAPRNQGTLGIKGQVDRVALEARDQYEVALKKYFVQDFESAIPHFEAALRFRPMDKACEVLRLRCQNLW